MVTLPGNGKVSAGPGWMKAGVYDGRSGGKETDQKDSLFGKVVPPDR